MGGNVQRKSVNDTLAVHSAVYCNVLWVETSQFSVSLPAEKTALMELHLKLASLLERMDERAAWSWTESILFTENKETFGLLEEISWRWGQLQKRIVSAVRLVLQNFYNIISQFRLLRLICSYCRQIMFADSLPSMSADCRQTLFCLQAYYWSASCEYRLMWL